MSRDMPSGRTPAAAGTPTGALQSVLAAENAAIFGYGVAGAYLSGPQRATATAFWNDHRVAADTLAAMLRARGAQPAAADDAYKLPFVVHTVHDAISLAAYLENGVTSAYLGLVASGGTGLRGFGARAMRDSAVRGLYWRGSCQAFPGFSASPAGSAHVRRVQ